MLLAEDAGMALGVAEIGGCHWPVLGNLEMAGEEFGIATPSRRPVLASATWACHLLVALA
jgi:ABC-type thiamine transport system ATPase subunit